ncbi:hypothetical protein [Paenibacillus sp. Leaf72]|uniref:hypothetical protein n=1 Tax=Paenibacillus sp. Leaf72 TaxID=1736234 RepID=UPI0006FB364F|nr:hypothetical protein [Paenibacillus sp. Leaf72]KQN98868.1 hypothetical protein ASF12_18915 [Paenibacillus sp. Leaf72]
MNYYSLEYICENMLDNAKLKFDILNNPHKIILTFMVYEKADNKYFKVVFEFNNYYYLNILKDIEASFKEQGLFTFVLEVSIKEKPISELNVVLNNETQVETYWELNIIGDFIITIKYLTIQYHLIEVNEEVYRAYSN